MRTSSAENAMRDGPSESNCEERLYQLVNG